MNFQTSYLMELSEECDYIGKDMLNGRDGFIQWEEAKRSDMLTYRDMAFQSRVTGEVAAQVKVTFWNNFDDSLEGVLKRSQEN